MTAAPATHAAPLLTVRDLTVTTADGTPLVSDISFDIAAGERFGLIGESGSGKSVTSLALTGLLAPGLTANGSVLLAGTQTVGATDAVLRPLRGPVASIVFQEPLTALDPLMRVGRQVAEPIRRHRGLTGAALDAAVRDALAEVALTEPRIARAYPHELSGGQRQRIAIAIALGAEPRLLIADEPTTALDVTVQQEVLTLLDRLVRERGMALLFISHDLAVVSQIVDRITVMQRGRAVETGATERVLWAPEHEYTQRLVASARALDAALDVAPGAAPASSPSAAEENR
ncbi:ATP-binding cassette domain-containing protein [Leucobacter chromiireducens]|uniref:ABC transporter ATP-binding protein n=1 Tax=Leucobacter chromiireducens subsp. solipictus TaxID=398235 RepID=A0ABS1SCE7_9MICO|nr:ABC transporter ATP-binding protein [Leucobacter chromiireducens]MBL3678218.1 ABC transporter ATP-binding protein [Leucobacter chromiireducens subsp. solipictus]